MIAFDHHNSEQKRSHQTDSFVISGRILRVKGLLIECSGQSVSVGDLCYIEADFQEKIPAEVIGFDKERIQIMPFDQVMGLKIGSKVFFSPSKLSIPVGDCLLGQVIDPLGNSLNPREKEKFEQKRSIFNRAINPMMRPVLNKRLSTGIRVVDGFLPIVEGQRMGIFAGPGVGKSSLLRMIAYNSESDVNVIAMIGERGREVREFIESDLGSEGMAKSVVVVSTSDSSALSRVRGAYTALSIAEYFRDKGKKVMLLFDSLTRLANAQREIGLALGEPPSSRGYPPSIFSLLPNLLERCGALGSGSITGFFTILTEGDDLEDPISDLVRGILDGHLILDRKIAEQGIYPSIDVLRSISRLSSKVFSQKDQQKVNRMRSLLSLYKESEDLIKAGIYIKGSDPEIDLAILLKNDFNTFMSQQIYEKISYLEIKEQFEQIYQRVDVS